MYQWPKRRCVMSFGPLLVCFVSFALSPPCLLSSCCSVWSGGGIAILSPFVVACIPTLQAVACGGGWGCFHGPWSGCCHHPGVISLINENLKEIKSKEHNKKNLPEAQIMLSLMGQFLLLVLDRRGGGIIDSSGGSVVMLTYSWENKHIVWLHITGKV